MEVAEVAQQVEQILAEVKRLGLVVHLLACPKNSELGLLEAAGLAALGVVEDSAGDEVRVDDVAELGREVEEAEMMRLGARPGCRSLVGVRGRMRLGRHCVCWLCRRDRVVYRDLSISFEGVFVWFVQLEVREKTADRKSLYV
jgi:hypothetical protein